METILCMNCSVFYGSTLCGNLCSQCYKSRLQSLDPDASVMAPVTEFKAEAHELKEDVIPVTQIVASPPDTPVSDSSVSSATSPLETASQNPSDIAPFVPETSESSDKTEGKSPRKLRCQQCRKRLQLVDTACGECHCGAAFCSQHRHPEDHSCTFDHRTAQRDQLRTKMPTVVAAKMNKI